MTVYETLVMATLLFAVTHGEYSVASNQAQAVPNWRLACADIFTTKNITEGLIDQQGRPMAYFDNQTLGISETSCYNNCGREAIYQVWPPSLPA
jgi:hypothetical protein